MRSMTSKIALLVLFVALGIFCNRSLFWPVQSLPEPGSMQSATTNAFPVRLRIQRIGVDSLLETVGLTTEGNVGAPKEASHAAWFSGSPRPGLPGNAIIDGHFGWKDGKPAVFDNLHTVKPGDRVTVEDAEGRVRTFIVRELRTYNAGDDTRDVFKGGDSKAHLVLITCEGEWNKGEQSYADRLVVFADLEE